MTVVEALKRFRKEYRLTQKDVAEFLGIDNKSYQYHESNGRLSADFLAKIATRYNVSADYLLGLSDNPHGNPDFRHIYERLTRIEQILADSQKS